MLLSEQQPASQSSRQQSNSGWQGLPCRQLSCCRRVRQHCSAGSVSGMQEGDGAYSPLESIFVTQMKGAAGACLGPCKIYW